MTDYVIRARRAGVAGLESVRDLPIKQEMPPSGGYPAVRFARSMPNTGPSGAVLFAGMATVVSASPLFLCLPLAVPLAVLRALLCVSLTLALLSSCTACTDSDKPARRGGRRRASDTSTE